MPYILVRSYLNPGFGGPTFIDYHAKVGEQGEFGSLRSAMSHLLADCTRRECRDCSHVSLASNHNAPYCSYQTNEPPYLVLNSLENMATKLSQQIQLQKPARVYSRYGHCTSKLKKAKTTQAKTNIS